MIAQLRGSLEQRDGTRALIDVNGVGYEIQATSRALDAWAESTGTITAVISTQVREDAITLFAFPDTAARAAFQVLMSVSGVGAKMALSTLDTLDLASLVQAIETDDVRTLQRVPGVGKRTAQRLALELKGKLPAGEFVASGRVAVKATRAAIDGFALALERLGWSKAEIEAGRARVAEAGLADDAPVGERVRIALRSSLGAS